MWKNVSTSPEYPPWVCWNHLILFLLEKRTLHYYHYIVPSGTLCNPRVRCAFGNVLISMPSYAAKLSHYHYELHITQYCAMQTFTFWQKSDMSVLNQTFSIQFWSALQPWFNCKEIRKREIFWYFPIVDCWLLISTRTPPDEEITPTLSMLSLS